MMHFTVCVRLFECARVFVFVTARRCGCGLDRLRRICFITLACHSIGVCASVCVCLCVCVSVCVSVTVCVCAWMFVSSYVSKHLNLKCVCINVRVYVQVGMIVVHTGTFFCFNKAGPWWSETVMIFFVFLVFHSTLTNMVCNSQYSIWSFMRDMTHLQLMHSKTGFAHTIDSTGKSSAYAICLVHYLWLTLRTLMWICELWICVGFAWKQMLSFPLSLAFSRLRWLARARARACLLGPTLRFALVRTHALSHNLFLSLSRSLWLALSLSL